MLSASTMIDYLIGFQPDASACLVHDDFWNGNIIIDTIKF